MTKKASLADSTWERDRQQVHKWVIPYLGNKPIASLEAPDLLEVLKRIGALAPRTTQHLAAITDPAKVGALLRAIDGYDGQPTTGAALKLAPYVFVRPGELRAAEWSEIVLDNNEPLWRIPVERMKMREAHIVPLARQPVEILRALQPITGRQRHVFPAIGGGGRPLSENTLNGAIRRLVIQAKK